MFSFNFNIHEFSSSRHFDFVSFFSLLFVLFPLLLPLSFTDPPLTSAATIVHFFSRFFFLYRPAFFSLLL